MIANYPSEPEKENTLELIKSSIRTVPNWPKKGVMFRDITTLLKESEMFGKAIELLALRYENCQIDVIAGVEARGFVIGAALANALKRGFVPIRKAGKLPADAVNIEYELEYGRSKIEVHKDAIYPGCKVLLVDDLIATGGTALAACELINKCSGEVFECCFIVDLPNLGGKRKLEDAGFRAHSLVAFEGE
ncbi:MAG: adenine phosphoribosyltransferase [Candidatus Micrarchaeota archaeon]